MATLDFSNWDQVKANLSRVRFDYKRLYKLASAEKFNEPAAKRWVEDHFYLTLQVGFFGFLAIKIGVLSMQADGLEIMCRCYTEWSKVMLHEKELHLVPLLCEFYLGGPSEIFVYHFLGHPALEKKTENHQNLILLV
jgi:hypothetical protein